LNTIRRIATLILTLCAFGLATAQDSPPESPAPWWKLLVPNDMLSLSLSPDGTQVVGMGYHLAGAMVILIDVRTMKARRLISPERIKKYGGYTRSPRRVRWIGNELLAVDFNDLESESVDLDGKKVAELGESFIGTFTEQGEKADWVLAYSDIKSGTIARVNARTGEKAKFKISLPGRLVDWAFDAGGALRAVTMMDTAFWSDTTKVSNWYRASETSSWQLLEETSITQEHMEPLYAPPEPNTLVVASRQGRDTTAIFRYDVLQHKTVELMAAHATEDIVGVSGLDQEVFRRVSTAGLKRRTFWFDERWASLQATVDAAIPARTNVLSGEPLGRVLVFSYSDVDPGRWFLLDADSMTLKQIAEVAPLVKPESMRPVQVLTYTSTDGLRIPAYLTLPSESREPAPLIVLIHGGPQSRDSWSWDQEVQILAMNGYAVFQPQFRGSTGFGKAFEEAGYGQWGLAMQDDITAGVHYLIDQKIADPARICILGASYGGYAALWGVIKTPKLYKCGISMAGVTDVADMLEDWSDRNGDAMIREIQRKRIGSVNEGRDRFDLVSPVKHAAEVEVPLLIMHGALDRRVPIAHSKNMVHALSEAGKNYEWVTFPRMGHGFEYVADSKYYYTRVLSFLNHYIGPQVAGTPEAMASSPNH